jgi:hypothetical protein
MACTLIISSKERIYFLTSSAISWEISINIIIVVLYSFSTFISNKNNLLQIFSLSHCLLPYLIVWVKNVKNIPKTLCQWQYLRISLNHSLVFLEQWIVRIINMDLLLFFSILEWGFTLIVTHYAIKNFNFLLSGLRVLPLHVWASDVRSSYTHTRQPSSGMKMR